jgi:uncharacterized protein involved in exopolysaccharide biosynthesis
MESMSIRDLFEMLRRRKLAFLIPAATVFILMSVLAFLWSNYRSTATIQVVQPDIPEGMVAPLGQQTGNLVEAFADQRIEQIQQTITSTSSLIDIITKFNLYPEDRAVRPMTEIVLHMQNKIKLELLGTDLANPAAAQRVDPGQLAAIAFTLSFTYDNPLKTQQVTNELMSRFLDEDIRQRRQQAQATSDFLAKQIADLEKSMEEQEKTIGAYRAQHVGVRPEDLPINMQIEANATQNVQAIEAQMRALEKQRGDLQAQLAGVEPYSRVLAGGQMLTTPVTQLKALQAQLATMTGEYGAQHPDVIRLRHQIEALQDQVDKTQDSAPDSAELQAQITDTRTNLAAAEKTYGPDHPDVKALRRQLQELLARRVASTPKSAVNEIKKDADNPAYLMLVSQIQSTDAQYKALQGQYEAAKKQQLQYQTAIAQTPQVEQEIAALSRDYDNAQLRYRELKEKKLAADMGQQMEQGRQAERMVVIDSPELPTETRPPRWVFVLGGVVLAVMSGFGGAFIGESLSRSVHGVRHLIELTGITPLVAVPHIFTKAEKKRILRQRLQYLGASIVVIVGLGWLFSEYVMPLDVLWSVTARRLGIS